MKVLCRTERGPTQNSTICEIWGNRAPKSANFFADKNGKLRSAYCVAVTHEITRLQRIEENKNTFIRSSNVKVKIATDMNKSLAHY